VGIKEMLKPGDPFGTREWLVENVKGIGYKEASHFLRNIGLGRDMAVLDVHILRNLKRYDIIDKRLDSLTRKSYMDIENRMRKFSERIDIPMEELDLLFWAKETGFIFK
jgi:N-glycosylase/DNA lyase